MSEREREGGKKIRVDGGPAASSGGTSHVPAKEAPPAEPTPDSVYLDRGPELPGRYHEDRITALVRDPHHIFFFWELEGEKSRAERAEMGEQAFYERSWILRLHNRSAGRSEDVAIHPASKNWYQTVAAESEYEVEIGVLLPDGSFLSYARSNGVRTPRPGLSPDLGGGMILRRAAAEATGFGVEQILHGNGSDEILNNIVRAFAGPGDAVAMAVPTYPYYHKLIDLQGATAVEVPYPDSFELPAGLARAGARLTFIANPNSPSGTVAAAETVATVVESTAGMVVVDEAYVDFAAGGFLDLVRREPRVIVTRTMSKSFSLAGLRIGFCFADADVAAGLWKVKEHYNVNTLSQVAAAAALDDIETMRANARRVVAARQRLTARLRDMGFQVWDSQANFVLARIASPPAAQLHAGLKERGILVRYFETPRLSDCLRISIGTDAEIGALLEALGELL